LLVYLVPQSVDVVPIKFHQFLFGEWPAMIIFVFFNFLAFWPFPWQRQPFWKIIPIQHNFTWHMIFLQGFIKFDQGISEK
jgi:hypothetical protein